MQKLIHRNKRKMERKKGTVQATISLKGEQLHRFDVPGSGTCSLARRMKSEGDRENTGRNALLGLFYKSRRLFLNLDLQQQQKTDSTLPSEALAALKTSIGAFLTEYMKQNAIAVEGQDGSFRKRFFFVFALHSLLPGRKTNSLSCSPDIRFETKNMKNSGHARGGHFFRRRRRR